ncbi:MAG: Minf_1886 family protein [Phycisphaerales bacterium]
MHEHTINLQQIFQAAGGYSPACFPFIRDGLAHTAQMIHGQSEDQYAQDLGLSEESRHVDGTQLCLGLRDHAISRYGLLAKPVLNKWGIYETKDFGNIIFALVEANLMRTTDDDSIEDFDNVFDFDDEFGLPVCQSATETVGS